MKTLKTLAAAALAFGLAAPAAAGPVEDARNVANLAASWAAFGEGDFDLLATFYTEDMIFVLPGQDDVLEGRDAFRAALDGIGAALPPGFAITEMTYAVGDGEVVNLVRFNADKLPDGSQLAIAFRFNDEGLVTEERWFIDTEQWKAAF